MDSFTVLFLHSIFNAFLMFGYVCLCFKVYIFLLHLVPVHGGGLWVSSFFVYSIFFVYIFVRLSSVLCIYCKN